MKLLQISWPLVFSMRCVCVLASFKNVMELEGGQLGLDPENAMQTLTALQRNVMLVFLPLAPPAPCLPSFRFPAPACA
ncbi:hypothetical protein B0T22DRAFT_447507 [Podospora appendiculata]|uniref:Secreted protein n=1 Tax=Podospora appendiculata TaxID=314037 RepID=A0AAE0XFK7_9PEZI|nr:hypothetical protein B0T22DRAFT_447507 [Podospora appendiculata]